MREATDRSPSERSWRVLTAQLGAWHDLLSAIDEQPGMSIVVSDPWSGTTGLLQELRTQVSGPLLLIDARRCTDAADLGMAIADEAVRRFAPEAAATWVRDANRDGAAELDLRRRLDGAAIPEGDLRDGSGDPLAILRAGVDAAVELSDGQRLVVALDHLGRMLEGPRVSAARAILEALRAARQAHVKLDLVLVDYTGGPIEAALADRRHPLFQAGHKIPVRRPDPEGFAQSLIISKPMLRVDPGLVLAAAEQVEGIPALTWKLVDLAQEIVAPDVPTRVLGAWHALCVEHEPLVVREWDVLRAVHPAAQSIVAGMSAGLRPHAVVASKTAGDALRRLRGVGVAWQPAPRTWALTSPLLEAWAATHPPPWATRQKPAGPRPR